MPKFPKVIYVRWEEDGDRDYLVSNIDTSGGEDGQKVAIYSLSCIKNKRIVETLE